MESIQAESDPIDEVENLPLVWRSTKYSCGRANFNEKNSILDPVVFRQETPKERDCFYSWVLSTYYRVIDWKRSWSIRSKRWFMTGLVFFETVRWKSQHVDDCNIKCHGFRIPYQSINRDFTQKDFSNSWRERCSKKFPPVSIHVVELPDIVARKLGFHIELWLFSFLLFFCVQTWRLWWQVFTLLPNIWTRIIRKKNNLKLYYLWTFLMIRVHFD